MTEATERTAVAIQPPTAGASKDLRGQYDELLSQASTLEEHRKKAIELRNDLDRKLEADDGEIFGVETGHSVELEASNLRDANLNLLREELQLRKRLAEYLGSWHSQLSKTVRRLSEKKEKVAQELLEGLVKFGYHDPEVYPLSMSRVLPGMIHQHPKYVKAFTEAQAASGINLSKPTPVNDRHIDELKRIIKDKLQRMARI